MTSLSSTSFVPFIDPIYVDVQSQIPTYNVPYVLPFVFNLNPPATSSLVLLKDSYVYSRNNQTVQPMTPNISHSENNLFPQVDFNQFSNENNQVIKIDDSMNKGEILIDTSVSQSISSDQLSNSIDNEIDLLNFDIGQFSDFPDFDFTLEEIDSFSNDNPLVED